MRDRQEWDMWNTWRSGKNEFNRDYILALIDFYPEPGVWLFGGIYQVLERGVENFSHSYKVRLTDYGSALIGRLKVYFQRPGRIRSLKLENYLGDMTVSELLKESYLGERFPGYDNISHDFPALETVFNMHRPDWKTALENVKGVYCIVDKSNGYKYVGSAYGDTGIWARWAAYIGTGHGWNDDLSRIIDMEGIDYARQNFRITLLEYHPARTEDRIIIERESFWKEALLSRGTHGYNKN